jgi:hypothetical protein
MNESLLPRLCIPHGHIQCVCGFMSALTNVTIDSQTIPFTYYLNWVSTGSDMHVVTMVNLQLHMRSLIVN